MKKIAVCMAVLLAMTMVVPARAAVKQVSYLFTTSAPEYSETGVWNSTSNVPGVDGTESRYTSVQGSNASWQPDVPAGRYKIYTFKTQHVNSLTSQPFDVTPYGKDTTTVPLDFTAGIRGWAELGIFDLAGNGQDIISTTRAEQGEGSKATRTSAVKLAPVSEPEAVTQPGDSQIIHSAHPGFSTIGNWRESETVIGYDNEPSYYSQTVGDTCEWKPQVPAGNYTVSVYKVVHASTTPSQQFHVLHNGKSDAAQALDYTTGTAGWLELGTYDFAGDGTEKITYTVADGAVNSRVSAVKLELRDVPDQRPSEPGDTAEETVESPHYFQTGNWKISSDLTGYQNAPSKYLNTEGEAGWRTDLKTGLYKVYVYKTMDANSLSDQPFAISSGGRVQTVTVDFTSGESGWVLLGTYQMYGDGSDFIKTARDKTKDRQPAPNRINAVRYELVELVQDERPQNPGDSLTIRTTDQEQFTKTGSWTASTQVLDDEGNPTLFLSGIGEAAFVPYVKQGNYRVWVYKTVHSNSLTDQTFFIGHRTRKSVAAVDYTQGTNEWVDLGTYDFDGTGQDYIKVKKEADESNVPVRLCAVRLELVDQAVESLDPPTVLTTAMEAFYKEIGNWRDSSLNGYQNKKSRYMDGKGNAVFTPYFPSGTYKVSVYRIRHDTCGVQAFTINHAGMTDTAYDDFSAGESGWNTLGTYEFWGNGEDTIKVWREDETKPLRLNALRFERLDTADEQKALIWPMPGDENGLFTLDIPVYPNDSGAPVVQVDGIPVRSLSGNVLLEDEIMVPAEGFFQKLGWETAYDATRQKLTVTGQNLSAVFTGGSTQVAWGNETKTMLHGPTVEEGTLRVPAVESARLFGCTAEFDAAQQRVSIVTDLEKAGSYFMVPKDFHTLGTWKVYSDLSAYNGCCLLGKNDKSLVSQPAKVKVNIQKEGDYQIFIHSRDYDTYQGERFFHISVNGVRMPATFGQSGKNRFVWETTNKVHLTPGELEISLLDTSTHYARCDGIFLTDDLSLEIPPDRYEEVAALADVFGSPYQEGVYYPQWAKANGTPSSAVSISSDRVRMNFYTVPAGERNVVQKDMAVDMGEGFVTTSGRENYMGALLLQAMEGSVADYEGQFPLFQTTYETPEGTVSGKESDLYKIGRPDWLIPSAVEKVDQRTVRLLSPGTLADAVTIITLPEGEQEPKVTFTFTPKADGVYTANLLSGPESSQFSRIFAPFRFNADITPNESVIVSEPYLTVPIGLKTIQNQEGAQVTIGVAVDPACVSDAWPKREKAEFGISIRGPEGGALPSLAAPLFTSSNARMQAQDSYTITYHMVERPGDWYGAYEHLATGLYGLTDYRKNYFSNLNTAIFNATELAASSQSGWDDNLMGYYNIEYKNAVTQSNPMVFLSTYFMTEDKEFLTSRTIPTLAYLLSRPSFHYTNGDGTNDPLGMTGTGRTNVSYGSMEYGGLYHMTNQLTQAFKAEGIDKGILYRDEYGVIPDCQESLWMYKYTKDEAYLTQAKQQADAFIAEEIDGPKHNLHNQAEFIAIDFYPQFQALIDLYEVCGEQGYLDAAVRAARELLPTVWIYPNDTGEDITISADNIRENHYSNGGTPWYGKQLHRVGYPENMANLADVTVPFWVSSRAGLSLEQTYTYTLHDSGNMIMTNWAPDLIRLAKYSGEEIFETYARNAVVGRHTTYPGYYYNNYFTYQMDPEYPYQGPDLTGLYWHHIQPFIAMLQDFLITETWSRSDQNIDFPSYRNAGYAYFSNRMYGSEPGKFYDQKDMWLWLKDGLVQTDEIQLDWVGARKEGKAAFAFLNQDTIPQTAQVTLGAEVTGGVAYNGTAAVYDAQGNVTQTPVADSQLTITVPAKGICSILLESDAVARPAFAVDQPVYGDPSAQTALPLAGETDTGQIIQVDQTGYFAYVYLTEGLHDLERAVLHYQLGNGQWQTVEDTAAPYEFIIECSNPQQQFTYFVEKVKGGQSTNSSQKQLSPLTYWQQKISFPIPPVLNGSGGSFGSIVNETEEMQNFQIAVAAYDKEGRMLQCALSPELHLQPRGTLESVAVSFGTPVAADAYQFFLIKNTDSLSPVQ